MVGPGAGGEFALIDWIRRQGSPHAAGSWTRLGIGDDCAILDLTPCAGHGDGEAPRPPRELLVTTDMLMDGRHFRLDRDGAEAIGYKAMGVNLSDIAAMAGIPRAAVVAVALPRRVAAEVARGLHAGMRTLADRHGVELVGGDTNAWDGPLVIAVTVLGEATERGAVRRSARGRATSSWSRARWAAAWARGGTCSPSRGSTRPWPWAGPRRSTR